MARPTLVTTPNFNVEGVFCEGWDVNAHRLIANLSKSEASARDAAGDQYSAALLVNGQPRVVVNVCRRWHHVGVWLVDELGRLVQDFDFRRLEPDRMFLAFHRTWDYDYRNDPFTWWSWRYEVKAQPNGEVRRGERYASGGSSSGAPQHVAPDAFWRTAPTLDDWRPILDLAAENGAIPGHAAIRWRDDDATLPALADTPPWHPPMPLQPADFDTWFRDGTRLEISNSGGCTIRTRIIGSLRLPTGRLVAAEPGPWDDDFIAFTEPLPPGTYPVSVAGVDWDRPGSVTNTIAAVKIHIRDEPVVKWDMALRPDGPDPRLLRDGGIHGFGVDGGTGGVFDEQARDLAFFEGYDEDRYAPLLVDGFREFDAPGSPGNVIMFDCPMGDGGYPTWFGRTANGDIAAVLVDLELLRHTSGDHGDEDEDEDDA